MHQNCPEYFAKLFPYIDKKWCYFGVGYTNTIVCNVMGVSNFKLYHGLWSAYNTAAIRD